MKHWSTLFREADGSVSSTRVLMLAAGLLIVGTWAGICVAHHRQIAASGKMIDIPWGVVAVFGICCGLKWAQLKHESGGPADAPDELTR